MAYKKKRVSPWLLAFRILFTMALIFTIAFIFGNSLEIAEVSSAHSQEILTRVNSLLARVHLPTVTEHIVRKCAHFLEYCLEGFWLMLCLRVYTSHFVRHVSWPLLLGLGTALCDETLQMFVSGRASQLTDVWIDFAGLCAGLVVAMCILLVFRLFGLLARLQRLEERDERKYDEAYNAEYDEERENAYVEEKPKCMTPLPQEPEKLPTHGRRIVSTGNPVTTPPRRSAPSTPQGYTTYIQTHEGGTEHDR